MLAAVMVSDVKIRGGDYRSGTTRTSKLIRLLFDSLAFRLAALQTRMTLVKAGSIKSFSKGAWK